MITSTIAESFKSISVFFIGAVPVFMAFTCYCESTFYKYPKFIDTTASVTILFAMANGDAVHDVYMQIWVFIIKNIFGGLFGHSKSKLLEF